MPEISFKNGLKLLLDNKEYEIAKNYNWCSNKMGNSYYIYTCVNKQQYSFKNLIFKLDKEQMIFHKNDNLLDFRRSQILIVSRQEYFHMTKREYEKSSKYRRVYYDAHNKKWGVNIVKGKGYFGGRYVSEIDAAIAADYLSVQLYSKNAERNFTEIDTEELVAKYQKLENKYGSTAKEKRAKTVQGIPGKVESKSSRYVGVSYVKLRDKWAAEIRYLKKRYCLGSFESEVNAARAYDMKAIEIYGDNAKTNFPK